MCRGFTLVRPKGTGLAQRLGSHFFVLLTGPGCSVFPIFTLPYLYYITIIPQSPALSTRTAGEMLCSQVYLLTKQILNHAIMYAQSNAAIRLTNIILGK